MAVLVVVWFTMNALEPVATVPVKLAEEAGGDPNGRGTSDDEPTLDDVFEAQSTAAPRILANVGQVLSFDETPSVEASLSGLGRGGDGRRRGPGGSGKGNALPRHKRWELRFPSTTLEIYMRQLDLFGIELGALGGGADTIDIASDFCQTKPKSRSATAAEISSWLYLSHQGTASRRVEDDRSLLSRAGISAADRIVVQLIPPELELQLATLEQAYAGKRSVDDVSKTVFSIREKAGSFELFVLSQQLRTNSSFPPSIIQP